MRLSIAACLAVLVATGAVVSAGDEMLYVWNDDRLVFTNTPAGGDAKPVPGLKVPLAVASRRLPETIYDPFIRKVAGEVGIPASLIKAVTLVESNFDPHAVSPKGAQGLMQLMPATASQYGVRDAFDPLQNLRAGSLHLSRLLNEFDGDLTLALAAYNAGSEAVRRHGGVPDYAETRNYVRKVSAHLGRKVPPVESKPRGAVRATSRVRLHQRGDGSVLLAN